VPVSLLPACHRSMRLIWSTRARHSATHNICRICLHSALQSGRRVCLHLQLLRLGLPQQSLESQRLPVKRAVFDNGLPATQVFTTEPLPFRGLGLISLLRQSLTTLLHVGRLQKPKSNGPIARDLRSSCALALSKTRHQRGTVLLLSHDRAVVMRATSPISRPNDHMFLSEHSAYRQRFLLLMSTPGFLFYISTFICIAWKGIGTMVSNCAARYGRHDLCNDDSQFPRPFCLVAQRICFSTPTDSGQRSLEGIQDLYVEDWATASWLSRQPGFILLVLGKEGHIPGVWRSRTTVMFAGPRMVTEVGRISSWPGPHRGEAPGGLGASFLGRFLWVSSLLFFLLSFLPQSGHADSHAHGLRRPQSHKATRRRAPPELKLDSIGRALDARADLALDNI